MLVTGPPGAGKSTVAAVLVARWSPSALVAGDDFFAFLREGYVAPWLPASARQNEVVVEAAAAATGRLAAGGLTVVYDGVIGPWIVDRFCAAAAVDVLHYVVLLPPEDVCRDHVRSRHGHGFTDLAATAHMYREFAAATLDARHVVRPAASDELAATVDAVAAVVDSGRALVRPS